VPVTGRDLRHPAWTFLLVPRTLTRPLASAFTANRPTSRSPSIARAA
jgi:hypothetical protein